MVFRGLKLVTRDVLESGVMVAKIMQHLGFITDQDKNMYRAHIELAMKKQIRQYRDNSVKNIKWKYKTKKGNGPSKSMTYSKKKWEIITNECCIFVCLRCSFKDF